MKLMMRAKMLGKKITLISTAFVLAVSTLTASLPFVLSSEASAAPASCEASFTHASQKCVGSVEELNAALDNTAIQHIILSQSITTDDTIIVDRPVTLNGWDKTITFTGDDKTNWAGNYVVQVWNTTGVTINSLRMTGGDAALYVNGSEVRMTGHNHVSGNQYGGIQVGGGKSPRYQSKLTYAAANTSGQSMNFVNATEATDNPTIWTDKRNNEVANLNGVERVYKGLNGSAPSYQDYYYLSAQTANVVATNTTKVPNVGYASVEAAADAANAGDVIRLEQNIQLASPTIRIRNAVTLEGNNKIITTTLPRGAGGVSNAAIVVLSDNVKIQNLTTVGIGGAGAAHGIVVNTGKVGVVIENVTLKNGAAGIIVNGAEVTVKNIKTENNNWYGINVANGAQLALEGTNTHDSNVYAVYGETTSGATVIDNAGRYARILNPVDNSTPQLKTDVAYVLTSAVPTATLTANGQGGDVAATGRETVTVQGYAVGVNPIKSHWFEIKAPNGEVYYQRLSSAANNVSFDLKAAQTADYQESLQLDSKNRPVAGVYEIRYVATDVNNIRNDATAPALLTLTADNTLPSAVVTLSNNTIVSNNTLPTVTINGADNATGISKAEYKIVRADNQDVTVVDWTEVQNNVPTTLSALASLPDGSYAIAGAVYDGAGNRFRHEAIVFTINREITATFSVSSLRTATPTLNGTVNYSNGAPVANETLTVTVDGVSYLTTTSAVGAWSVTLAGVTNGTHGVTVALNGVGVIVDTDFETTIPVIAPTTPVAPANEGDDTPEQAPTTTTVTTPAINNFAASVLGVAGGNTAIPAAEQADDAEVKGTSTLDTLAQAVDADNNDGKAMGLAWYWWLLIVAGIATIVWWIVAAARRRSAES